MALRYETTSGESPSWTFTTRGPQMFSALSTPVPHRHQRPRHRLCQQNIKLVAATRSQQNRGAVGSMENDV